MITTITATIMPTMITAITRTITTSTARHAIMITIMTTPIAITAIPTGTVMGRRKGPRLPASGSDAIRERHAQPSTPRSIGS